MKKALLLFSKCSAASTQAIPEELIKLLNSASSLIIYESGFYEDLVFEINQDDTKIYFVDTGIDIKEYDIVYHRRWGDAPDEALACYVYLDKFSIPQIDSELNRKGSTNKLTQHMRLWQRQLPFASTVYFKNNRNLDQLNELDILKTLDFPCIVKSTSGTRGSDNYKVESKRELCDILLSNPNQDFLIQEYIENNGDYRVFVCGDQVPLIIFRQSSKGDYRNNISVGGTATLIDADEFDQAVIHDAIKAAKAFNRDIAGVDVVFRNQNHKDYYFFEVNRSPQIESSSYEQEKAKAIDNYFNHLISERRTND